MASPALVGTRPQRTRDPTYTRDSNALRASVLDAALELGVGTSRAVENLIFDSILEDDEVSIVLRAPFPCFLHPSFSPTLGLHHLARRLELVTYDTHQPIGHIMPVLPPLFYRAPLQVRLSKGSLLLSQNYRSSSPSRQTCPLHRLRAIAWRV